MSRLRSRPNGQTSSDVKGVQVDEIGAGAHGHAGEIGQRPPGRHRGDDISVLYPLDHCGMGQAGMNLGADGQLPAPTVTLIGRRLDDFDGE